MRLVFAKAHISQISAQRYNKFLKCTNICTKKFCSACKSIYFCANSWHLRESANVASGECFAGGVRRYFIYSKTSNFSRFHRINQSAFCSLFDTLFPRFFTQNLHISKKSTTFAPAKVFYFFAASDTSYYSDLSDCA